MILSLTALACFVASAAAHATFQELWINGVDQGSACVRLPLSNSPVTSVTTDDIACNADATPSNGICGVNPGDTVTVEMHQQPGDRSCATQAIGGDHYGPINIYMAQVSNALTAVGSSASWFKVSEMGMPSMNPDYWATEVLNDNCGHFTFTIPAGIAPGNYLLRAEVIALHVASSVGGAQFYMSCYQLSVGGTGTTTPSGVSFPGAYSATDPGILINIYQQLNTYAIPGPAPIAMPSPAVATAAWPTTATWNTALQPSTVPTVVPTSVGGGGGTTVKPTSTPTPTPTPSPTSKSSSIPSSSPSSKPSSSPSSSPTSKPSSAPTPSPTSTGATAAQYGQCGGIGWTGPTVCAAPYTCTVSNSYYSQCL